MQMETVGFEEGQYRHSCYYRWVIFQRFVRKSTFAPVNSKHAQKTAV